MVRGAASWTTHEADPKRATTAYAPGPVMAEPERIGRYDVVAHLATGGMGQVFLARSSGPGGFVRHFVVKTLDLPGTDEDEAIAMFLDEARLLGLLHHQHISPVYEVGKDNEGQLFLVMDYVHGHTAHEVWQRTNELGAALPIDFSLTVAASSASGLHYAHTRRDAEGRSLHVVHRDVSLSNLMIGFDGGVKLIDFGIAKAANRSAQTQVGFVKGKLGYMAPEQLRGIAVDARTDVFALGIVLYELTTMRRAFREESELATMERIRAGAFTPPSAIHPEYPPDLERIVTRALRVDPRERYPDAEAMRREIDLLGHQLGLVLGDAAIVEVMSQLFEQRGEPWQRATTRPPTELDVALEVVPGAPHEGSDSTRRTEPQLRLRAATEAADSQLLTPPHGLPKRPSMFSIEGGPKSAVSNDTDGVTIVPAGVEAAAAVAAAIGKDTDSVPAAPAASARAAVAATVPGRPAVMAPLPPVVPVEAPAGKRRLSRLKLPPVPRRRRSRLIGWIAVAVIVAGAAAGGIYLLGSRGSAPAQAESPGPAGAPGAAIPPAPPAPAPRREPDAAKPAQRPAALPPGAPLELVIKTTPPDATVLLDGKRLGRTPYSGTIEAAAGTHALKIRKRGYVTVNLDVGLDAPITRDLTLQRAKGEPSPSPAPSPPLPPPP